MDDFTQEQIKEWKDIVKKLDLENEFSLFVQKNKNEHEKSYEDLWGKPFSVVNRERGFGYNFKLNYRKIINQLSGHISFAITESLDNLNHLSLLLFLYSPTPFSLVKSREIILDCLNKKSEFYDLIPLVYTTFKLPTNHYFNLDTWREIVSTSSFENKYYGHLDIIGVLKELIKEEIIEIPFFDLLYVDTKHITFKFSIIYKNPQKINNVTKPLKENIFFEIKIKDREIRVNNYIISKPQATGKNLIFFEYIYEHSGKKIKISDTPTDGKRPLKILGALGFSGALLKAFFPERSDKKTIRFRKKISTKEVEDSGINLNEFISQLEFLNNKNCPK